YRKHQGRDIRGSSSVEFVQTEPKAAKEPVGVTWPMYGYDAARLRAPLGFKVHPPFRRAPVWTFRAQALLEFPPVVAYSRIYIVNNAGTVFALHQQSGKVLWKYRTHRCSAASPAVGNHLVFVSLLNKPPCNASHGVDGKVIAFDAETGRIRWQRTIGPSESSPLLADGMVIVGDWSHDIYAFTAASGNLRWHFKSGGLVKGAISQSGNRVYFGAYDTHVYSFDAATGDIRWRFHAGAKISGSASVIDGVVYFSTLSGRTFGLNARNGKLVWSYPTGQYAAAVASKSRLYVIGYSKLYALIR